MAETYEPDLDLDTLTRAELADLADMPEAKATADVLDDWLMRLHGTMSSGHGAGLFLDLLAAEGFRVAPIEALSFEELLPPSPD